MPQKEVQINKKWYWELEQKDEIQVFMGQTNAFFSDDNIAYYEGKLVCCFKKGVIDESPFMNDWGQNYKFCALQSSEHEKKSRRCTDFELNQWLAKGNGFWIDYQGKMKTKCEVDYDKRNNIVGDGLVSICTWDGNPMEPTAQNMGLPE